MEKKQQSLSVRMRRFLIVSSLILVFGVALFATLGVYWYMQTNTPKPAVERTTPVVDGNLEKTSDETVISTVAETVSPSVVSIMTNVTTRTIFGAAQQQAAGTGVIMSRDGYVMTNKHVIKGADEIQVIMNDGTIHEKVEIVGIDPLNDVAFLKIKDVSDLRPATLGDSSTVRVGQHVVAIGNALGQYQNTVSSGIISGKGRPVAAGDETGGSIESLTDLLQTDAAINPGNSGGPLLNRAGQVIGINTAVAQGAEGIGFAIPINATKGMLKLVLAGKTAQRAYLGLRYVPLTAALSKHYQLPVREGAYVAGEQDESGVQPRGPADRAGIKDKDIITKINNLRVGPQGGVSSLVGEYAPGDTVTVTILRDGKSQDVRVTLGAYGE